jgi:hypothetical protein
MSYSNRRHAQVGGGKRSHATLKCYWKGNALLSIYANDATPNSLKDSNANLKMETKKGIGVHFLICSISGVKGAC